MKVGGQAVIEGVMMRNKEHFAVAVRLENGNIKLMKRKSSKFPKYFNLPFIRGVIGLYFMLYDGIKGLIWSSNQQLFEDEQITTKEIVFTLLISFAFSIAIFVIAPFFIASSIHSEGLIFDLLDGVLRLGLFLIYLAAISFMKDINVLFQYHGAEHKTINCYESGEKLTVSNAQRYSRFSPRCGTSFLFIVFMVSILLFTFLPEQFWLKLLGRIVLIPFVAGLSYEIVKLSDKFSNNFLVKILIAPGLWLQRLTTREPSDRQVKVAIEALDGVLRK